MIPFTEKTNVKIRTFLVSMDVMSLDTNIPQNEGILKLSVTKHMKISTKTTHSLTLLAGNAQNSPQRNCSGHKDSSFDSFANVFKAYIETTTLSKTIFRTTVCGNPTYTIPFPYGTCGNQTLKPSLNNNLHHPTIKFMAETFDTETAFLDTAVYKGTRVKEKSILDAKTHFKQIETFLHTHFTSYHPPSVKKEKP